MYPFQNLSHGFILKIFLKFRKSQSRYSYKIYFYIKKECTRLASNSTYYINTIKTNYGSLCSFGITLTKVLNTFPLKRLKAKSS